MSVEREDGLPAENASTCHYLVGAQGALQADAAGNACLGSFVYYSGNLVLDLLDNLTLELTGRSQK